MSDDDGFKTAGNSNGETWDKENTIIGKFVGVKHNVGPNDSELYQIQEDGKEAPTGVWGSTVLDGRFEEINLGSTVKITYLGKKKGKNGTQYADYEVKYKDPEGEVLSGDAEKEAVEAVSGKDSLPDPKDV